MLKDLKQKGEKGSGKLDENFVLIERAFLSPPDSPSASFKGIMLAISFFVLFFLFIFYYCSSVINK